MFKILTDDSRNNLLTDYGKQVLQDRYMLPHENTPQDVFERAASAFASDANHAQRMYDYVSKQWCMLSTPILTNGGTTRGMPIACYLNYVPDSRAGLNDHYEENSWLASLGGGIGGYWGDVRSDGIKTSKGSQSNGSIPFQKIVDVQMLAFSQGSTRRGSYASYLDISHPEIEEFITFRKPSGGDSNRKCLNLHHGVNLTDAFMEAVENLESWDLIDPHTKEVVRTVDAFTLWTKILDTRMATGEPYLHFVDTSNKAMPESQRKLGLRVRQSNLCSEITLATNETRTAVCCLSSVNLAKWDEWKDDEQFIGDLVEFLDNVLTFFIEEAPVELDKAAYSAFRERSIGIGAMGFHSYLQSKLIPFESAQAIGLTNTMFKYIKNMAVKRSEELAVERGTPMDMQGTGRRNAHLLAVAPNASSSIICGNVSPSIEPLRANAYTQKTLSGSSLAKNPFLDKIFRERTQTEEEYSEAWRSVVTAKGSVQEVEFLTEWEKDVFKTALEIDQDWVVEHAGVRQKYICQSQSVNTFFDPKVHKTKLHKVHFDAWKKGLKSLYYLRSESVLRPEVVSKQSERVSIDTSECLSCEG